MDLIWILISGALIVVGIIGCIVPVIPGPPISYIGLLVLQLKKTPPEHSARFLTIWALITAAVTVLDYIVPVWGTKKFGGSKYGMWGSMIGLFIGLFFFPPFGIIVGPFAGAVIGEMIKGSEFNKALKSGFGSFIGFLAGTIMKLAVSFFMAYYYIVSFF
jgi:uncharacterized protein YqgC (DUF456 family)